MKLTPARFGQVLTRFSGVVLMGIGVYFVFFRPPFLPEDLSYIGSASALDTTMPSLGLWLNKVFIVLGGFIFSNGLLTVAATQMLPQKNMILVLGCAWISSIGLMTAINFLINSAFKWSLLALAVTELIGIANLWISTKTAEKPRK